MSTPPRFVRIKCPACKAKHWVIDCDFTGNSNFGGRETAYKDRIYICPYCGKNGAGFKVRGKLPVTLVFHQRLFDLVTRFLKPGRCRGIPDSDKPPDHPRWDLVEGLLIVEHPNGERSTVFVLESSTMLIGRGASNQIMLCGPISRNHAQVRAKGHEVFVSDLSPATGWGVLLNGVRIEPGAESRLQSGDVLTIEKTKITFQTYLNPAV
jgi:FHA domain